MILKHVARKVLLSRISQELIGNRCSYCFTTMDKTLNPLSTLLY